MVQMSGISRSLVIFSPVTPHRKSVMCNLSAEEMAGKKVVRIQGLSLDAIRRRKALKPHVHKEEDEGT